MKNLFLLFAFAFTTSLSFSQDIVDVAQYGSSLSVRDAQGHEISNFILGSGEFCGFSSTIIVLKYGNSVTVYDQKFRKISDTYIASGATVKNVVGNNIIIKNGKMIITYDKNWKEITSRIE